MLKKIYIVTDLGPGDGGKGGVVHKIANQFKASVVLKFGGGQGSHGIKSDTGEEFAFSHWGCATLEGISTVISPSFVAMPHAIMREADELRRHGIDNAYLLLTIDPRVLCATPIHQVASRIKELARKDHPRGTIGTGVGEAYRLSTKCGEDLSIRMQDLYDEVALKQKLRAINCYYQQELASCQDSSAFLLEDQEMAGELLDLLYDDAINHEEWILNEYRQFVQKDFHLLKMEDALMKLDGVAVAECSHGVLTDAEVGFKPHTSAIRTLPIFVRQALIRAGFEGQFVNLGVTRAYAVRHGAGPLPTANDRLVERLLPGSHKMDNRWQGRIRAGALDFKLLKYAIDACGGPAMFDGLCITWVDQLEKDQEWWICTSYRYKDTMESFDKEIDSDFTEVADQVYAEGIAISLGKFFAVDRFVVPHKELQEDAREAVRKGLKEEFVKFVCDSFRQNLGIPVRMISLGPDDKHKILL